MENQDIEKEQRKIEYAKEREEANQKIAMFNAKMQWSYEQKLSHAIKIAEQFRDKITFEYEACYHISVGGLDSITLLLFLRKYIDRDIKAISVSGCENVDIQRIHRELGVERLKSCKSKIEVINEFGFPVISKEKAAKIALIQNPTDQNTTVRHAIMTGETGAQGGYQKKSRMKLPQKWLDLFGGVENEKYGTYYKTAPFKVSADCCYYLKEKPCEDWAKANNSYPYLGLMASEGGRREKALKINGCNYYGKGTIRSCPFAIFTRQDLLRLAVDLNVPVPKPYGEIVCEHGIYRTTLAQRTGCEMCGFGIHLEDRPHRFDRLRVENPKAWEFWMNSCATDKITGEKFGWGRVLDYIGVEWQEPLQISIFDLLQDLIIHCEKEAQQ